MTDNLPPFETLDRIKFLRVHGDLGHGTVTSVYQIDGGEWWADVAWDNDPATSIDQDTVACSWLHMVGSSDPSPCQSAARHVDLADDDTCCHCGAGREG